MTSSIGDDCPREYRLVRRAFIGGSVAVLASSGHVSAAGTVPAAKYMAVSSLLINHHLDSHIGERLAVAMSAAHPGIEQDIDAIIAIAQKNNAKIVEDFFPALPEGRVKECALAIISAWYTGTVADAPGSQVFSYELALMYQPTKDVMTIPSYAISGPNGWTAWAPDLNDMPEF